ncbi:MAG TPA: DUF4097 family beta strand repeat-containing protein [Spirochaetia bacterium]|nr:DUF4097 family beta strand repeat-containing protein [Spirochaetia bacterium]
MQAHTSNNSIKVRQVKGDIVAVTTNGTVSFNDISGRLQADTTNGSVDGESAVGGEWTIATTNGAIKLQIPSNTSAKMEATTSNAKIGGDAPWLFDAKGHGGVTLGAGDHQVNLKTSNGSVTVEYIKQTETTKSM